MYHSYGLSLQLHNNLIASKLATLLKPLRYLSRMGVEGGGYILIAQKNKVAMTPVKVQWEKAADIPDAELYRLIIYLIDESFIPLSKPINSFTF